MWRGEIARVPGIRKQAAAMLDELRQNQLVVLRYPDRDMRASWQPVMVAALNAVLFERGEALISQSIVGRAEEQEPENCFRNAVGCNGDDDWAERILEPGGPPLVVELDAEDTLSPEWEMLFRILARYYRNAAGPQRGVLLFVSGGRGNALSGINGISCYCHWMPVCWEEMRLLARAWLPPVPARHLHRSWAISTYVGASNGDPSLLKLLCDFFPGDVGEVVSMVRGESRHHQGRYQVNDLTALGMPTEPWGAPGALLTEWEAGLITGWSYERGPQLVWHQLAFEPAHVHKAIWREQVSGLMPTIIELGNQTNRINSLVNNAHWKAAMWRDDQPLFTEPGKVLSKFKKRSMPGVLKTVYEALKDVRDRLAHLEPVERSAIDRVAEVYERACEVLNIPDATFSEPPAEGRVEDGAQNNEEGAFSVLSD